MKIPFSFIRNFFPKRIFHQILLISILLMVVPLVLMGGLLIGSSKASLKTTILRNCDQTTLLISSRIKENLQDVRRVLEMTASFINQSNHPNQQNPSIKSLNMKISSLYPSIKRISLINFSDFLKSDTQFKKLFFTGAQENLETKSLLLEQRQSNVFISPDETPSMYLFQPIYSLESECWGLLAEVDLQMIWNSLEEINIGKNGSITVVDEQGRIIGNTNRDLLLKKLPPKYDNIIDALDKGKPQSKEFQWGGQKRKTNKAIIAYSPIGLYGWGIIIERSALEAYVEFVSMKMKSLTVIGLSIIVAIIISFLLSRFISRLINDLIEGINKISRRDYSCRFRIQRKDDIGKLLYSFNKMSDQLKNVQKKEKLSVVGKAASKIAHELKNSLLLVNTFINMIPQKHTDKAFMNEFSDTIPKELDYWNKMLKQMMDSARPEKIPMEYIDINPLLQEIVTLAKFGIEQKKIKMDLHFKSDIPPVFGNAEKLKQVFLNLLTNSIEATPIRGSIEVETNYVDFDPGWTATFLEIKVTNSCKDMKDIDPEKVFDPYYTTKKEGVGLGLSICRDIIKKHGGIIEVANNTEEGISFSVQLPINKDLIGKNTKK